MNNKIKLTFKVIGLVLEQLIFYQTVLKLQILKLKATLYVMGKCRKLKLQN